MIPRENRFHGTNSLRFVYSHGSVERGPFFAIKYADNKRRSAYRVAVVVSKKVSKSAVVRNRIRRRLYEAIRERHTEIKKPFDIAILVYNDQLLNAPAELIRSQLEKQLKKAEII